MELTVGPTRYRLVTVSRDGQWFAHAIRVESGDRFGVEAAAAEEEAARARLIGWLEWQHAHTAALKALQRAERNYHRARADAAFGSTESSAADDSRSSLAMVDAARSHLDDVRTRRPVI
jgi:hypothetical protein